MLLFFGMLVNLNLVIGQKADKTVLKLKDIEALAATEAGNPYYPCVKGKGFCFKQGTELGGMVLIKK